MARCIPCQQAFIDQDALQCGYCTPGQILSAIACVEEGHAETRASIQEFMSGTCVVARPIRTSSLPLSKRSL